MCFLIQNFFLFFLFLTKIYVVGTHWKHLSKALLMSTHNISFFFGKNKKTDYWILSPSWHYKACPKILSNLHFTACCWVSKPLTRQSQQLSSAVSSACDFKSHFCKQCGPRLDCFIRVHTVSLYAKIGLKSLQEYSADDINRWHFQMQIFLAF